MPKKIGSDRPEECSASAADLPGGTRPAEAAPLPAQESRFGIELVGNACPCVCKSEILLHNRFTSPSVATVRFSEIDVIADQPITVWGTWQLVSTSLTTATLRIAPAGWSPQQACISGKWVSPSLA